MSAFSRERGDIVSIKRTHSLPIESLSSAESPTRATFPFKPASALIKLQHSQSLDDRGSLNNNLPPHFRPRPLVPASSQPLRCASFPTDPQGESLQRQLKPPDWITADYRETAMSPFPVSISLPVDNNCYWLNEMGRIIKEANKGTIVRVGDDEIELVESTESEEGHVDEVDVIEKLLDEKTASSETMVSASKSSSEILEEKTDLAVNEPSQTKCMKDLIAIDRETAKASVSCWINGAASEPPSSSLRYSQQQYSFDELRIIREKMKDLKDEIEHTENLDPEKRRTMEEMFQQVDGAIESDENMLVQADGAVACAASDDEKKEAQLNEAAPSAIDHLRRTTVAITGGTLTAAGIVLIPCPIIPGCVFVYGGLLVLATEFDAAKKVLDTVKGPLEQWLADDEEKSDSSKDEKHCSAAWEEIIGYSKADGSAKRDIDVEFTSMMCSPTSDENTSGDEENKGVSDNTRVMKQFLRKVLMLESAEADSSEDRKKGNISPGSDDDTKTKRVKKTESDPLFPSCPTNIFSFDCDDSAVEDITDIAKEMPFERLCSDGSITLNTLQNCDDETIRIFSRQNTNNSLDDCPSSWIGFGCHSFLDVSQLKCQLDAIEKKR